MKSNFLNRFLSAVIVLLLFSISSAFTQPVIDSVVHWKKLDEIKALNKITPRPIFTYFYNPADDSSKVMLKRSINQKEICTLLNGQYYALMIETTTKDTIHWFDNKDYVYDSVSGVNELTSHVFGKKVKLPAILVYNDEKAGSIFEGYKTRYELRCILLYFTEQVYRTTPFDQWSKSYQVAFVPIGFPKKLDAPIKWHPLKEALALQKKQPKGLFINWYVRLNASCYVMLFNAFEDPKVAKYLNENFYCVSLDARSKDTLYWDKPHYYAPDKGKFNELAIEQLQEKMEFPALLFYDKDRKLIASQQTYLEPKKLFILANYAGSGAYKNMSMQEFFKSFKPNF